MSSLKLMQVNPMTLAPGVCILKFLHVSAGVVMGVSCLKFNHMSAGTLPIIGFYKIHAIECRDTAG